MEFSHIRSLLIVLLQIGRVLSRVLNRLLCGCSFGKMWLYRTHLLVLLLYSFSSQVRCCDFNDCICGSDIVICEVTDDSQPIFNDDELIQTESMQITDTQKQWFKQKCDSFPRLQNVMFRDNSRCPTDTCVPCL